MFFNDFRKIQTQNLKTLTDRFQVEIHFQSGPPWPQTRINSFTELVWSLNKKWSISIRFSFTQLQRRAYCPFRSVDEILKGDDSNESY